MRRGSFPSAVQAALVPACLPHVAGPHRRGPWCRSTASHSPLGPQRWIGLQKRPEMGSPPGAARSRPIKHRARDALALADLRHYWISACLDVARRRGPWVLRDQMRPARPRYFSRAAETADGRGPARGRPKNTGDDVRLSVMRGLDPRIHDEVQRVSTVLLCLRTSLMDCRVKPGNDAGIRLARQPCGPFLRHPGIHPFHICAL